MNPSTLGPRRRPGGVVAVAALLLGLTGEAAASPWVSLSGRTSENTCGVKQDGTVWCWGRNEQGQLGTGQSHQRCHVATDCSQVPVQVVGLGKASSVGVGCGYACALLADGTVWCWGDNRSGRLGQASSQLARSNRPVAVAALAGVTGLAVGCSSACAVRSDGTVACWGDATYHKLGSVQEARGIQAEMATPTAVSGLRSVSAVAVSADHACALRTDGTVWCWGDNQYGQLGVATTAQGCLASGTSCSATPVQVPGLAQVKAVDVGARHTCAVKADGTVWCWGDNGSRNLGDGTDRKRTGPVQAAGVKGAVALAVADYETAVLDSGGQLWWWGSSGAFLERFRRKGLAVPTRLPDPRGVAQVTASSGHLCVVTKAGAALCWGNGDMYGQLGTGRQDNIWKPTPVR